MFKKYQLKNGMQVLLVESHKSPVLSIQMWVKTGSADEKKGEEGISHFIEHLVFKGTEKYNVGEIASTVEASGGELNAYTSFDQTVFYVTISKEFEDVGLDVISEMMGKPAFDSGEIDNERGVVIEEIKRSNDSPHRQASRLLFETMYKKHPYGIPVIGYKELIEDVSRDTLTSYYDGRYNPKTMTLIVAGDFKSPEMKKKIDKHFAKFEVRKLRVVKRAKNQKQKPALVVKNAPFQETIVHIAFPIPKASHKDVAALEVLALILGQGESSRLNQRLRMDSQVVHYAGSSVFVARDPGFMAISLSLNDRDIERALTDLQDEVAKFLSAPCTQEELEKAQINMASEQYYYLETVDGLARKYGHYQDLFGDPAHFDKFMKQVQTLTPKDILKVARKYLDPKQASMIVMTPGEEKKVEPHAKKFIADFKKSAKKKPAAVKAKAAKSKKISWVLKKPKLTGPAVQKFSLPNDITLITRPSFETPVISLRTASLGGSRVEGPTEQGATELLSRVWTAGAGPWSESELNQRVDQLAGSISAFGGRNSEGLSMSCLKPFSEGMLDVLFHCLVDPHFEEEALQREIKSMQEHVKLRKDNPAQLCVLNFMKTMFGSHPYGQDPYGSEETIAKLDANAINRIFARKTGLTLVASGAFEPERLKEQVEKSLLTLQPGRPRSETKEIKFPKENTEIRETTTKEQTHILVGYPGLTLKDPTRYTLQVMQAILAGQGGRLFLELRDKASLAYSVSPMRMEGLEGGYFGAYIGCSPEKSETAIKMMHIEFAKLMNEKVGPEELARAQRYLIGKHDIELQKNSNITSAILFDDIYGIDYLETWKFGDHIRAVTSEQIQALALKIFGGVSVTSIVGR